METKHSPGPWTANRPTTDNGRAEVYAGSVLVAQAFNQMPDADGNEQYWADARLIAAAPDMLEVLQNCLDCNLGSGNDWVKYKIRAAIAKADGRLQDAQKLTELAYEAYCDKALK